MTKTARGHTSIFFTLALSVVFGVIAHVVTSTAMVYQRDLQGLPLHPGTREGSFDAFATGVFVYTHLGTILLTLLLTAVALSATAALITKRKKQSEA